MTELINIINIIVLTLTFTAIVWYTWETCKLRKINHNIYNLELKKREPFITVFFDNGNSFFTILFKIINEGGSSAKNVKVNMQPPFDLGDSAINNYFNTNSIFREGLPILPTNKEYIIKAGYTPNVSELYLSKKVPHVYHINVSFEDDTGKKFNNIFDINLDQFFNRIDPNDKTETEKKLEEISKNLKEINQSIKNLDENKY